MNMMNRKIYLIYLLLCFHFPPLYNSLGSLTTNQIFRESDLLVSKNGRFAFGFFTPRGSIHRYLGIWFHKISETTVVWVANRNNPLNGSSGFLSINRYGSLVLFNDHNQTIPIWATNASTEVVDYSVAQLLDTGNLVLYDDRHRNVLWQSFDYPTDTYLSDMKGGKSAKLGLDWSITSWRSDHDPGTGDFSLELDPRGTMQLVLYEGSKHRWRQHIWPHRKISGYEPKSMGDWHLRDGSGGCVRKRMDSSSLCNKGDGFLKVENVKFPDTSIAASLRVNVSRQECEWECLRECSCY